MLRIDGVTHWSIPVNNLEQSEHFYRDVLGLEHKGRLGNSTMSCFVAGDHNILLCERGEPIERTPDQEGRAHHSLTVSPESFEEGCRLFRSEGVPIVEIVYRERGFFTGRELYFLDPSGNLLELRDPTWSEGMPKPTIDEIASS